MAIALRFAPMLLIAAAVEPAAAQSQARERALFPFVSSRLEPVAGTSPERIARDRLLREQEEARPAWTFGFPSAERRRSGWSFGVRPGRGLKGSAKLRF